MIVLFLVFKKQKDKRCKHQVFRCENSQNLFGFGVVNRSGDKTSKQVLKVNFARLGLALPVLMAWTCFVFMPLLSLTGFWSLSAWCRVVWLPWMDGVLCLGVVLRGRGALSVETLINFYHPLGLIEIFKHFQYF